MKRRSFLAAISCLPFLGWLKPEPIDIPDNVDDEFSRIMAEVTAEPRLTDPNDWFIINRPKGTMPGETPLSNEWKEMQREVTRKCWQDPPANKIT